MKNLILIADDDVNLTIALAARLEAAGYEVLAANDGFQALKLALQERPDLIILDMWMPVGIGLSVVERLKERGLDVPMVFLSGCRDAGVRVAAIEVGAQAFLEKPYHPEELLATVERLLASKSELANCGSV